VKKGAIGCPISRSGLVIIYLIGKVPPNGRIENGKRERREGGNLKSGKKDKKKKKKKKKNNLFF